METLIPILDKLQEIFKMVHMKPIKLPQIVVIGSQSSGKSSVLESIIGRSFIPKGPGIMIRRPLIIQLVNVAFMDKQTEAATPQIGEHEGKDQNSKAEEWVTFSHQKHKLFTDFNDVQMEILKETDRISGTNMGISLEPLYLKIHSSRILNITLIDLPGITKVPVGDQSLDTEMQIKNMIMSYISNPHCLILATAAANTDITTCEALKLARTVDPDGCRTLAVITKLDLKGVETYMMDILLGQVISVKLGIIGVVNWSLFGSHPSNNISNALQDAQNFLQKKYPVLASQNGTHFLTKTINRYLMHYILECLSKLKARVNVLMDQYHSMLESYGHPVQDQNSTLLEIITRFATEYCNNVEGTAKNIETSEIFGGARLCYIFHKTFSQTLESISPLTGLTMLDIMIAIQNTMGPQPVYFTPKSSFELLVKKQIKRLEEPSLRCVELVHEELQRLIQHCLTYSIKELPCFPKLQKAITDIVTSFLKKRLPITKEMVHNLVAIELAYINTKHPDFIDMSLVSASIQRNKSDIYQKSAYNKQEKSDQTGAETIVLEQREIPRSSLRLCSIQQTQTTSLLDMPMSLAEKLNPREKGNCEMICKLIQSYFCIVRKNIQDSVPKTIMYFLVNYVKDHLQSELVGHLYKAHLLNELLTESKDLIQQRNEAISVLQTLKNANQYLSDLRETQFW
ncbi:LOW QUALITY PROTEIN: dynamin-1-like protein [Macrotis lagotis]|uniref:LOW QUALITY PROTEIN: dynamin-1-like protein n=1 Tax=Macrotis lagotis TaxID=92651 RepID=UPI003D69B631